jgi:hypothetical protein
LLINRGFQSGVHSRKAVNRLRFITQLSDLNTTSVEVLPCL